MLRADDDNHQEERNEHSVSGGPVFENYVFEEAGADGVATIQGDQATIARFLSLFPLITPVRPQQQFLEE
jgi:hypothetical protein